MNSQILNFGWWFILDIHTFRFMWLSNTGIENYLRAQSKTSNKNTSYGPVLMKESVSWISKSFANVIHKSLEFGVFDQNWKGARVTHIYKENEDINGENNYRPISVIGHMIKLVEADIKLLTTLLFQWTNLLIWKGIQTSLRRVTHDWHENNNVGAIMGALLDMSKYSSNTSHNYVKEK